MNICITNKINLHIPEKMVKTYMSNSFSTSFYSDGYSPGNRRFEFSMIVPLHALQSLKKTTQYASMAVQEFEKALLASILEVANEK